MPATAGITGGRYVFADALIADMLEAKVRLCSQLIKARLASLDMPMMELGPMATTAKEIREKIETAACELASVDEAVVFGVPDAIIGEELAIVVYAPQNSTLTEHILRAHLEQRLAGYKVPRYIQIVDQPLPQNASGKLLKRKIQQEFITRIA